MEKNTNDTIKKMLEEKRQIEKDYTHEIELLEKLKEKLYSSEVEAYFNCIEQIEELKEEKRNKEIKNGKKCKHNLYYLKEIETTTFTKRAIIKCVCCQEMKMYTDLSILEKYYSSSKLISGYDKNKSRTPFIIPEKYLGSDVEKTITDKYLEVCTQVSEIEKAFIKQGYEKYLYLIKSPEEVISNYFKLLFKDMEKHNLIHQSPIYIKRKTKREYL